MPGALDVLVEIQFQSNDKVLSETNTRLHQQSNIVKELQSYIESLGNAATATGGKLAGMSGELHKQMEQSGKSAQQLVNKISGIGESNMQGLKKYAVEVTNTGKQFIDLSEKLKTATAEMQTLEQAGQASTARFEELSVEAGTLQNQIDGTAQRIKALASDTKYIDALTQGVDGLQGVFTGAQNALSLFGVENEKLNTIVSKVGNALSALQSIQSVANALNKDSALSVLLLSRARTADTVAAGAEAAATEGLAVAEGTAAVATRGLTAAIASNPIGALAVAIVAVVAALAAYSSGSDEAEDAAKNLNKALDEQNRLFNQLESDAKRRASLAAARLKAQGASEAEQEAASIAELRAEVGRRVEQAKKLDAIAKQIAKSEKATDEEKAKARQAYADAVNSIADAAAAVEIARYEATARANKEAEDKAERSRKRINDIKKDIIAAQKELAKKQSDSRFNSEQLESEKIAEQYKDEAESFTQSYEERFDSLTKYYDTKDAAERNATDHAIQRIKDENIAAEESAQQRKLTAEEVADVISRSQDQIMEKELEYQKTIKASDKEKKKSVKDLDSETVNTVLSGVSKIEDNQIGDKLADKLETQTQIQEYLKEYIEYLKQAGADVTALNTALDQSVAKTRGLNKELADVEAQRKREEAEAIDAKKKEIRRYAEESIASAVEIFNNFMEMEKAKTDAFRWQEDVVLPGQELVHKTDTGRAA